jgi:signal transduction histidine kinase/ActR/RegA family two-component response regulator
MNLKIILTIAGVVAGLYGSAQQILLDSLIEANAAHPLQDEKKLILYNQLSDIYEWMQQDSGILYADKAIALANQLNKQKELAAAYNNKAINLIYKKNDASARSLLDKALAINLKLQNTKGIADNYVNLGVLKFYGWEVDSSQYYLDQSRVYYQKANHKNGIGLANYWTANILSFFKKDSSCLKLYHECIQLFEETGYETGLAFTYDGLGSYYIGTNDFIRALEWLTKTKKMSEKNKIVFIQTFNAINLSEFHSVISDYPKALQYGLEALHLSESTGSVMWENQSLGVIARIYTELNQYPEALEYYQKSIGAMESQGMNLNLCMTYYSMGNLYSKMNQYDEAFLYFEKSINQSRKDKDKIREAGCYASIGKAYYRKGQYELAILNFQKAIAIDSVMQAKAILAEDRVEFAKCILQASASELIQVGIDPVQKYSLAISYLEQGIRDGVVQIKRDACFELSALYEKNIDSKNALLHYKKYVVFKDSIMNSENAKTIANFQIQFDVENKEQEILLLNKDKNIQQGKIVKQKLLRNGFVGGFVVMLCFAGIVFVQRNRIKKGNKLIVKEKEVADQQRLRAEQSERFKQQFLTNMSHEIRTPMNAVMGMTNLLLQKQPRTDQEPYLSGMQKSAENLLHIINDILDLSKIEAGKIEIEKIDFSLQEVAGQVEQILQLKAVEKDLQLLFEVDPAIPVLLGDPVRLYQVLMNLVGNAIKFTEKGSVHLAIQRMPTNDSSEIIPIQFKVADTGIGIPKEKLETVFEDFQQASSSDSRKYGGTGLGLTISKQLVELLGGSIAIESEEGIGTTFSFILKFDAGSAERLQQELDHADSIDGSILDGLKILVADDNEYNLIVATDTLHLQADLSIMTAHNGNEAIRLFEENEFDLILMDVQMPELNGFEATRYIRDHFPSPKKDIPIIALTASVLRIDLDKTRQAGMNTYISKPYTTAQLIRGIAEVMNIKLRLK